MVLPRALLVGLAAVAAGLFFRPGDRADPTPRAGAAAPVPPGQHLAPNQVAAGKPDKNGIVTVLRPVVTHLAPGDPVRIVLHLATEKGPITIDHPLGRASVWADETLASLSFRVTTPDGATHTLRPDFKPAPPPKGVNPRQPLYEAATHVVTLAETGLTRNAVSTASFLAPVHATGFTNSQAAKWAEKPAFSFDAPGRYGIAVTGAVAPEGGAPVPFESATLTVERVPERFPVPSQAELVRRLRAAAAKDAADLKLSPDAFVIEETGGGRLVRVRAEPAAPKPGPGGAVLAGPAEFDVVTATVKPDGALGVPVRTKVFGCVAAGTRLDGEAGAVAIEAVRAGDRVWGFDPEAGKRVLVTVRVVAASRAAETLVFGGTLRVTANHPVFAGGAWKDAGAVRPGDELVAADGSRVRAGEPRRVLAAVDVYDLAVDGPHTFFAGGYLVHNKSIAAPPAGDLTRTTYFVLWPDELPGK
ncbi:polymorphic toxin-type HINT domain-containing protein [Gemmata sp.]|uniref:Hint domain-containing protein n=1 Tax=Gemmata sp. TaxID=1914242 RepID=UPI003F6FF84A